MKLIGSCLDWNRTYSPAGLGEKKQSLVLVKPTGLDPGPGWGPDRWGLLQETR